MTLPALVVPTRSAHWGWDEHRFFGHKVFEELAGHESFMGLTALSVLGRRLSTECCAVLEDAANTLTLADPRIWPLKLTRVVASYGGTVAAAAAGLLVEEGAQIGPWACGRAAAVLTKMHAEIAGRHDDDEHVRTVVSAYLEDHAFIWGFGTPFRSRDERLVAFRKCMREKRRDGLPYFRTMEAVAKAVRELKRAEPNIVLALAAVCLDMGLAVEEIGPLTTTLMQHMFFAAAVEGARQAPELLRELPRAYVSYVGREPRTSPRATTSE
jgi:hypothetical protein